MIVEHGPVDRSVETGRLVGQTHAKEQALTLGVEVERGRHVDRHGVITCHRQHRFGDEDVAWVGLNRNGDSGHFADLARPGARAVEDG